MIVQNWNQMAGQIKKGYQDIKITFALNLRIECAPQFECAPQLKHIHLGLNSQLNTNACIFIDLLILQFDLCSFFRGRRRASLQ